jgi:hypothetical protein
VLVQLALSEVEGVSRGTRFPCNCDTNRISIAWQGVEKTISS